MLDNKAFPEHNARVIADLNTMITDLEGYLSQDAWLWTLWATHRDELNVEVMDEVATKHDTMRWIRATGPSKMINIFTEVHTVRQRGKGVASPVRP